MLKYLFLIFFAQSALCEKRPNFVVILTDDQDVVLDGMSPMKNVQRFIADEGITFTNSGSVAKWLKTEPLWIRHVCPLFSEIIRTILLKLVSTAGAQPSLYYQSNTYSEHPEDPAHTLHAGQTGWKGLIDVYKLCLACVSYVAFYDIHGKAWSGPILLCREPHGKFAASPICCPSRSSILTGLYLHNHQTRNNSLDGGCYSEHWRANEGRVFVKALQDSGYNTFYAGKYLNQYGTKHAGGPERVPPGWTEWHGLVGNSVYYNYTLSNNGVATHSTDLYLTDVIRDLGISYIENQTESQPFLMILAPPAPHEPFTPAPRHKGKFSNVTAARHPNFNIATHDKHWLMSMPPSPLPDSMIPELDRIYRSRWESLLAVDEMVADVAQALYDNAFMENTYFVYTSDNGYHVGQFSQPYDKRQPYETDIRVPLVIRGPDLKKNVKNHQPITNVDLAPTILKLAGVKGPEMDGKPIDFEQDVVERYMLVEYYGEGGGSMDENCPWKYDERNLELCSSKAECKCQDAKNNTFACVRHVAERVDMKYCVFADQREFVEMYDLAQDRFELKNIANEEFQSIIIWYENALAHLHGCKGADCKYPVK